MNEAIGYVRVSSDEQADSGLGLQAQRQRITAFCEMKGLRLADVYEDAGVSAGKPLASRPAGARLLNAARRGKIVVVVAKLDRLFRSVTDAANVIADFDRKGIELIAIAEGFDMTNPYGRSPGADGQCLRRVGARHDPGSDPLRRTCESATYAGHLAVRTPGREGAETLMAVGAIEGEHGDLRGRGSVALPDVQKNAASTPVRPALRPSRS